MPRDPTPDSWTNRAVSRRTATRAISLGVVTALAGCLGGGESEPKPEPIDLSGGKEDDQGGMVIGVHAGPNGQIFYADNAPEDHDNPAWFHTLSMGLFPYYFEHKRQGWTATAIYVTDYSTVDYELRTEEGRTFISTHIGADTFGDAEKMTYVVDSDVHGGMGPDLIPFSNGDDASSFAEEHGGTTVSFDDITQEWLDGYLQR
ncbi:nitrous oxide reductase accessory protein NosL [Haloferax larsenii]|uniref:Nitrous oxide reductase accessory protein NosL n=1 Tax=Haloferax larsenii TaxID=302484 RepID=A0A1H7PR90_HALLR|nr:nitrous oxide reductase accessory protein NosL [Haloferax larsenii]SEL38119.1 Nitrous oxide reductase accessory protein NosL [Haloferax larsenii]